MAARTARPARAARPGADPRPGPRGRRSPPATAGPGRRRGRGRTRGRGRSADPWRAPRTRAGARARHRRDGARPTRRGAHRAAPTPAAWSSCHSPPAPPGERARCRGPPSAAARDGRARRGRGRARRGARRAGSTARRGGERRVAAAFGVIRAGLLGAAQDRPSGGRPHKGARHRVWRGGHAWAHARMPPPGQRSGTLPVTRVPWPGTASIARSPATAARRSRGSSSQPHRDREVATPRSSSRTSKRRLSSAQSLIVIRVASRPTLATAPTQAK